MTKTTSAPRIVVMDSLDRLENFRGEGGKESGDPMVDSTQACVDKLMAIKASAKPMGTGGPPDAGAHTLFYEKSTFMDPSKFYEEPLPRPMEKEHIIKEKQEDGTEKEVVAERVRWSYHYLSTVSSAGTLEPHRPPRQPAARRVGAVAAVRPSRASLA